MPPKKTIHTADNPIDRNRIIDQLIADATKEYGGGCVARSSDVQSSYLLRRPTGIISIDIAMAGGFPAAAPSVLVGPDGVGKDYILWRTAAEAQRRYGEDFCMACYFTEFRPDKRYMKDYCGLQIAMSEGELAELDRARHALGQEGLSPGELDHYRKQVGNFVAIMGLSADRGFDEIFKFLDANICQLVAVNSIGSLQTEAKEKTESFEEFAQQRNEASLLSRAMPKIAMYLNRGAENGTANETSLILVNQVRSNDAPKRMIPGRPQQERDTYKTAANSWALKHLKAIELFLHNGRAILDDSCKPALKLGSKKHWEITKGKLGTHEGLRGEFDYLYNYGADVRGDLIGTAIRFGLLEMSGSWINYNDEGFKMKAQGVHRAMEVLREDPAFEEHLRTRILQEAQILCRYT